MHINIKSYFTQNCTENILSYKIRNEYISLMKEIQVTL